jgi:GntR family transcriptional regulator
MTSTRFGQLAAELRERIALGDFGESGALESEATLGRRYDVSRVTVRRALEELRDQGLVESRRGAGWFVTGAAFHQTLALGSFRHATSAVANAGKQAVRRVAEFGYRPATGTVAVALTLPEGSEALYARSVRAVDAVPLDLVHEWVPGELAGRVSRSAAESPGIWATLQQQGHRVSTVRQTITAAVTTEADADLLAVAPGVPLLLVRRLAIAADGRPLALSDHRYLAHRFSLEVEFRGWPSASASEPPGLRAVPDHATDPSDQSDQSDQTREIAR